ncbi:MAG: discoidin domain-containing protein [Elusimicrobiota bacterium]
MRYLLVLFSALFCFSAYSSAGFIKPESKGKIKVAGRHIYVNGKPFFIKGVGYQAMPIGETLGFPVYEHKEIYERDLALLREMGCNTIRTWDKITGDGLIDACWNNGDRPIYLITGPFLDPADIQTESGRNKVMQEWREFITKYKDHPAILMWQAGNEANYAFGKGDSRPLFRMINDIAKMAYEIEGENYHPFTTANGGMYDIGENKRGADDGSMDYLDAWGANCYPGKSFWDLFQDYASRSEKPFWLSEYGCDAFDVRTGKENQEEHSIYVTALYKEMEDNSDICSGGTIMAYSDEWWKAGNNSQHDSGGWKHGGLFDGMANEEWWGVIAVEKQAGREDKALPRKVYYDLANEWKKEVVIKKPKKDIRTVKLAPGDPILPGDIVSIKASSENDAESKAVYAADGKYRTRWDSAHGVDPAWLMIELNERKKISGIHIKWEVASAKKYRIEFSNDGKSWSGDLPVSDGAEREERIIYFDPRNAKYVRIFCEERATEWGYSIWEVKLNPDIEKNK